MGADRRVKVSGPLETEAMEKLLKGLNIAFVRWNERLWNERWRGWKAGLDIELEGREIHLHYAYWGGGHEERAEAVASLIIGALHDMGVLTDAGRWSY